MSKKIVSHQDLKNEIDTLKKQLNSTALLSQQLKNAKTRIVELENLVGFGESAADIAHEISNPVSFATTSVIIAKRSLNDFNSLVSHYQELGEEGINLQKKQKEIEAFEKDIEIDLVKEEFSQAINVIEIAFKRIQEIAKNLSLFGKQHQSIPIKLNINESIKETLSVIKKKLNNQIEVKEKLGKIPDINSYSGKLNQVFINIIKNALEAIREKPELNNEFLSIQTTLEGKNIIIKIKDSGVGMTEETKEKLFKKFYTTKSPDKGSGLGMGICKRIIEDHKGTIEIESERGKGTTFTISLPIKH